MKNIPFIILATVLCFYTLIYGTQAIAQGNNSEEKAKPVLITLDSLKLEDLQQISEAIKVQTVIDGKTFVDYNSDTYMLAGLDIHLDEGDFSRQAKEFLDTLIKDKTLILFETRNENYGRENRMGHTIVHAVTEDHHIWVQGTLMANGMARVRTTEFNPEQSAQLLKHEESARKSKVGIWKNEFYTPLTTDNAHNNTGGFQIVEGAIKKVATTKNNIYLSFGDNWKTDFTVGIAPAIRKKLSQNGISPLEWTNKDIRVRGWIRNYNGPYIDLTHAEQIEILEKDTDVPEQE